MAGTKRCTMDLAGFLANAPSLFGEDEVQGEEIDPDIVHGSHAGAIRRFSFDNGDSLSCVRWDERFHITSTDIIRALVHRFQDIQRPVVNAKKFEEGVFSDLRSLKPGVHARLELPRSEFLDLLFKHHCVRTQKKQKVFFWDSVPHDMLFREALERDLKREAMGVEPTTKISSSADPTAHVVIGGVELPLTVPPTLAVHLHTSSTVSGSAPQVLRVSTVVVSPSLPQSSSSFKQPSITMPATLASASKASAVSIASIASSSHDDDATDAHAMYPESGGRYGDSADMLRFISRSSAHAQPLTPAPNSASSSIASSVVMMPADNAQPSALNGMRIFSGAAAAASQPSLSEYVSGKAMSASSGYGGEDIRALGPGPGGLESVVARSTDGLGSPLDAMVLNGSWTGMNFQLLHRQASDMRAIYNEYQPTPTPHHSPQMGTANDHELLELLSGDPNAQVTQENVGDFNSLLEELLGKAGRIQEGVVSPGAFALDRSQPLPLSAQSYSGWDPSQRQLHMPLGSLRGPSGSSGADADMVTCNGHTCTTSAMMESMASSPSVASMMHSSKHISPNHTPDVMSSLRFHSGGDNNNNVYTANNAISLNEISSILASAREPGSAVDGAMSSMSVGPILPMFSMDDNYAGDGVNGVHSSASMAQQQQQQPSFAASLAEARMSTGEGSSRSADLIKQQLWLTQKPAANAPPPRSSRFSRFHPYLKTMARNAHRDSPSLLNRLPSTADPTVAAAAVNAMAAKFSREEESVASEQQQLESQMQQQQQQQQQAGGLHSTGALNGVVPVAPRPDGLAQLGHSGACMAVDRPVSQASGNRRAAKQKPSGRKARVLAGDEGVEEEGESRRYTCTFSGCVKTFKRYEHLKRHFRTHTGERPYKCPAPECDKVFARMDNLNQHIRTHVNRKTANRRADGGSRNQLDAAATLVGQQQLGLGAGFAEDSVSNGLMFADSALFSASGAVAGGGFSDGGQFPDAPLIRELPAVQSPRVGGARGMRIDMPDELSLISRKWFINNSSPPQTMSAAAMPQPMQSPLMENNAVTMLRKISKSNRQRSVVGTPGAWAVNRGRDDHISPYFAADGLDLQSMHQPPQGVAGSAGLGRELLPEPTTTSNINNMWLSSFFPQDPQQQQQFLESISRGDVQAPAASLGFAMPSLIIPGPARELAAGRTLSLKRHLDEADEDVVMGCSRTSSRGTGGSGDEHQLPRAVATAVVAGGDSSSSKFVRSSMSSTKPHISAV
ncbi:hypothetical protein GGI20_000585 [Coemansia sp. BCRC 34301]|nr:hypothetical protein GGI20_000585 [Coemansia sp. BCRC 34301]